MRFVLIGVLLGATMFAQQNPTDIVTKLVELNNVPAHAIEQLVSAFDLQVKRGGDSRFITLHGLKANVDAAEQAIRKMDRPRKNIEATFQILAASKEANNEKLPPDLAAVVKQLKANFVFQGFRLMETLQLRAREGNGADANSSMRIGEDNVPPANVTVRFQNSSLNQTEKPVVVRLDNLRFSAKVPIPNKGTMPGFQMSDTGFGTDIDVKEGQTAVVGRANFDGKEGAFFLVVNVKVLD